MKFIILVTWKNNDKQEVYPTLTSLLDAHNIAPINTINNYISRKKEIFECDQCKIEKIKINRFKEIIK